jgi:GT2 family glycosyltransferase
MPGAVCAVVVTFNRRALVAECLEAVLAQTRPPERVLVVDNGSTDGTVETLRASGALSPAHVELIALERNAGSTGGFAAGVRAGLDTGAAWLWLMDDDAQPRPDCLERLLAAAPAGDPATAALAPAVERPDGSIDLGHRGRFRRRPRPLEAAAYVPGDAPALDYVTWVGPLVRAEAARAAGPPKAEMFIWADDYEYSFRLREQGELRLVPESVIVHHEAGQVHANRRSRVWNRLLGWDYDPTPIESFWRNLCGVRNYVWIKQRYEGQSALSAVGTTAQFMLKALLYDERPLRRLRWIARFARDGRRGRFENIAPGDWVAMVRRGEV